MMPTELDSHSQAAALGRSRNTRRTRVLYCGVVIGVCTSCNASRSLPHGDGIAALLVARQCGRRLRRYRRIRGDKGERMSEEPPQLTSTALSSASRKSCGRLTSGWTNWCGTAQELGFRIPRLSCQPHRVNPKPCTLIRQQIYFCVSG